MVVMGVVGTGWGGIGAIAAETAFCLDLPTCGAVPVPACLLDTFVSPESESESGLLAWVWLFDSEGADPAADAAATPTPGAGCGCCKSAPANLAASRQPASRLWFAISMALSKFSMDSCGGRHIRRNSLFVG